MQSNLKLPRGKCAVCGKEIPVKDTRQKFGYCSRVHATMARFGKRYRGSGSGPADRPNLLDKTKLNG